MLLTDGNTIGLTSVTILVDGNGVLAQILLENDIEVINTDEIEDNLL